MNNFSDAGASANLTCDSLLVLTDHFFGHPIREALITALFSAISIFGVVGNTLVILAVIRNPEMRIPRNYFIINLAASDLLLCCATMPLTLHSVLYQFWPFGKVACKLKAVLQGVNVFVSTMCITAIGLDRYLVVILVPTNHKRQKIATTLCFVGVWGLSILLATPLLTFTGSVSVQLDPLIDDLLIGCGTTMDICTEYQDTDRRYTLAYTISAFLFQYCLPLATLTFTYSRVLNQMRNRHNFRQVSTIIDLAKKEFEDKRKRRTNLLIGLIVSIFAITWLPFNIRVLVSELKQAQSRANQVPQVEILFNQTIAPIADNISDIGSYVFVNSTRHTEPLRSENDKSWPLVIFSICYLAAMMSACANPVLYGILNPNFRYEFAKMLQIAKCCPERMETLRRKDSTARRVYRSALAARDSLVDVLFSRNQVRKSGASITSVEPEDLNLLRDLFLSNSTGHDPRMSREVSKDITPATPLKWKCSSEESL